MAMLFCTQTYITLTFVNTDIFSSSILKLAHGPRVTFSFFTTALKYFAGPKLGAYYRIADGASVINLGRNSSVYFESPPQLRREV